MTGSVFLPPSERQISPGRRAAFWICRKGSFVVEAALAVPLFFFCMVSLICMMEIYGKYSVNAVRLQQAAEESGMAAGLTSTGEEMILDFPLPFNWKPVYLPLPGVTAACRARVRAWTGQSAAALEKGEQEEDLVYVSENESVYHTSSRCTHLSLSVREVSAEQAVFLRNSGGKRYHACEKCVGSGGMNGTVYITEEGDCYHNSPECSGLTRRVRLIPRSEAEGLKECSRCREEEEG